MLLRNLVHVHSQEDTAALSLYLSREMRRLRTIEAVHRWLADVMRVSPTALDVKRRITVRNRLVTLLVWVCFRRAVRASAEVWLRTV